jgi:Tol biopolymer transport system component
MVKELTLFRKKIKTMSQTITIPITAVAIIVMLAGTITTTVGIANVWAGTFPGQNGKIAFVRGSLDEHEFDEIYVMNADGSKQTRLTDNNAADGDPSWSPDGKKIAFSSERDATQENFGNSEIYTMNADGSKQTRLTNNDAYDREPSWSPDGKKIAFVTNRDDHKSDNGEIYIMNADGSGVTRLTNSSADDESPSWSPDGKKIAFVSNRDNPEQYDNYAIYVMNSADGNSVTRLTDTNGHYSRPSWSPDGKKIAFSSDKDGGGIFVMDSADGNSVTRLTADGFEPSWSPDDTKIAFVSVRDDPAFETGEIYIMNADDGSGQTRLTNNSSTDFMPDWGTATSSAGGGTTPAQAIDKLISTVQNLDHYVPQSVKTSLTAPLKAISHILNDNNPNNDKAACVMLDAFIKLVNVNERLDTLTAGQASDLRTQAQDIRNMLGC